MTPIAERVLEELQKFDGEPVRAGIIVAKLNCAGVRIARRTLYNHLAALKDLGLVDKPSERKWCAV